MTDRILMAPSILSADFTRLAEAVELIEAGGADYIHVDVMDGHFVPNMTIGPPVVKALSRVASMPLDVHLMIDNADSTVQWYLDAGADIVTVHVEACDHLHRVIQSIVAAGAKAGVSLNPATPVESLQDVLAIVDLVLVMSVNPGFGGQSFIPHTIERLRRLSALCAEQGASPIVEVDGGIDATIAPLVAEAGARVLVAGNAVFCQEDPVAAMNAIRAAGEAAL
ncbi:MAG: ribulose-phosphate 3-epimerase [Coriobacteriia bacterium]|nr:ribulose-phosphate 3-epimerase [Coriobacteriia bacterium]